jgi:hypothetical protein
MLMEHFLCDDVGGKHNVCGMDLNYLTFKCLRFSLKRFPTKIVIFDRQ